MRRFLSGPFRFSITLLLIAAWIFSGWPSLWQYPHIPPVPKEAHAAVGDIGIWRDSAGAQIPGTSFAAFSFATEQRNDGAYTFTGNNNLNLDEAGNYLLIATLDLDDNSNGRANYEGRFSYTGSGNFVTLYGSGYSRNNNNDRAWVRVIGLVWGAEANDDVQLEMRRDTDAPTGGSIANQSHFQVVRLHDSAAVGLYTDTSDTGAYGTQTWTDAPFNNIVLENDTSRIERQAGNTDFRIKQDNTSYLVGYGMAFGTGGSRTQRVTKMVSDSADIENSFSYAYQRNAANEYASPNGLFVYRKGATADEDLSVQVQRGVSDVAGSAVRRASTSGLFIVELPSDAEVFISHDSTAAQDVSGTSGDFNAMRDVDYNDSAAFTQVDNATVNAEKAMDVLLVGQAYSERNPATTNARVTTGARFEIQGTDQTLGLHGNYIRGDQGTQDTYNGAFTPAGLYAVNSGDDIQFEWFDDGDNGATDLTLADAVGFSALNLDSLEDVVVGNSLPVASGVSIDSDASSVTLTENTTKTVSCVGTVTDTDGFADITSVQSYFYRSSVGTSTGDNNNYKYQRAGDLECVPSGGSGNSETYTCDYSVQFYAHPTDTGSPYVGENWICEMHPSDATGTGTPATDDIEMDSLLALDVTSSVAYGTVDPEQDTGDSNATTTVTNTGNRAIDVELSGDVMCTDYSTCSGGVLQPGQQKYALSPFAYSSGGTVLTATSSPAQVETDLAAPEATTTPVTDDISWGIGIPAGRPEGTYTGQNSFTAVSD